MPAPTTQVVTAQRDFSAGELDSTAKRSADQDPIVKVAVRQASNVRILNTKGMQNRCGRRALFAEGVRVEEFLIAPGVTYYIAFPATKLRIYNSAGIQVFEETGKAWSSSTAKNVVWKMYDKSIYVTFTGMVPRILTWDGATTWSGADFAERVIGNQKRTLFYRIAPKGITLQPAASSGAGVGITFSANVLVAGMVGTRIRYNDRQMTIASVINGLTGTVNINEPLQAAQTLGLSVAGTFVIGDILYDLGTARGVVTALPTGTSVTVTLLGPSAFTVAAMISNGIVSNSITTVATAPPPVTVLWDQEVMNTYQGWPQSVFIDQNRLGFCNFPNVPSGIAWSAEGDFTDFNVGANPTDSIFELAPNKSQVFYVVPGMDGSEFVFCDNRLYYIGISQANPLKPGSVAFSTISEDDCGQVEPRRAGEFILYVTGGLNQVMAVRIFGAYTRAYKVDAVADLSAHLFAGILSIAIMTASASFAERYCFIGNADGSLVIGKYGLNKDGQLEGTIGWTPWTGVGVVDWVAARGSNVIFTTRYPTPAISIVEALDDSRYLDASIKYNSVPTGLPIPGGKGPLWWYAGGTVDLMDGPLGTRMMGTYTIDANGFLVPQNNAGEDFTSVNLICGQAWTATLEPFIPAVQPGQDIGQRMSPRRVARFQVYVANSSGFVIARLASGQTGPNLPVPGTVMARRRYSTWNQDEDPTQPPTLREQSYLFRALGRSHDPRIVIIKDTPGPLTVLEIATEVTV